MQITHSVTDELADIPAELADTASRRGVPVALLLAFDGGCWRLRLRVDALDADWPEEWSDAAFAADPDYQTLADAQYDGGYNWTSLNADYGVAQAMLAAYADYQRQLYPALTLNVEQ